MSSDDEDYERVTLLQKVSKEGFKNMNLEELRRLYDLVEKKDYSHNKKAQKSKSKLLSKLNSKIFQLEEKSLI